MGMETSPNFTPKVQRIIDQSKDFALSLNESEVTVDHLLLVILEMEDPTINEFIKSFSFTSEQVKNFTVSFCSLDIPKEDSALECSYSKKFNQLLVASSEFSRKMGHAYVCIEHIFFSLLNLADGPLYSFFFAYDVSPHKIIQSFILLIKAQERLLTERQVTLGPQSIQSVDGVGPPTQESVLDSFCVNLNVLASEGKIGNIIGKQREIDRVCEILCRKNKNNPLLLGEPGVGKTAIIEGLAGRIIGGKVPPPLRDKQLYGVDLSSMIAGTKYRGQFEQRIKSLISECKKNPKIILFVDEVHTIVGAGSAEGALDAANILKPSLARGDVKLIGATTFSEFKKNIEKDHALTRRFENVQVSEPSNEETYQILKGIKKDYENFHGVKYTLKLLKEIISLCELYIPSKRFPDKAIDVMDDIGTKVKIRNLSPPSELSDIEVQIDNLVGSSEINNRRESELFLQYEDLMSRWESRPLENVSSDDVLAVISEKAKIPKENLIHERDDKTANLKRKLSRDIINQDLAVSCMSRSILRAKLGLKESHKPIGSFLFLGSSGVGKTWSAKMIAKHYFGSEKNMFRLDMSEYSEKVSASKLIGASPGYVGYEEGGLLVEHMKKKPHCVLLFDEIEKADPGVQQLLLQILEEGEIEDNVGTKVYFKDSIIILTSNIGSELTTKSSLGFSPSSSDKEDRIRSAAKKALSPELINRLDEIIVFNHLEKEDLVKIFKKEIALLQKKLKPKKITLFFNKNVVDYICDKAASEKMGARPLKRLIHSHIEDKIVDFYFEKPTDLDTKFNFLIEDDEIIFNLT
jgi:ATP-dependent Clp protease ATP-binding subunit ClpC